MKNRETDDFTSTESEMIRELYMDGFTDEDIRAALADDQDDKEKHE